MLFGTRNGARARAVLAGVLWGATSSAAATISAFDTSVAPSSPFTITGLTYSADFFAADASISATVTCNANTTCSGEAIGYSMAIQDVGPQTPISAELVGNASAATSGTFAWSASSSYIVSVTTPFRLESGPFDQSILFTYLPDSPGGTASLPSLNLTMGPGQSMAFSLDIWIDPQPVPEPGSLALCGLGLFGIAVNFRRRGKHRGDVLS